MSKKYYWPTLWDNVGIILANEFIAPEFIYKRILSEGIKIHVPQFSDSSSVITLFSTLTNISSLEEEGEVNYPVTFEIDESCLDMSLIQKNERNNKVYYYPKTIFFNSDNIKMIFYSKEACDRTMARLTSSNDIKMLEDFKRNIVIKPAPLMATIFEQTCIFNESNVDQEKEFESVRRADIFKGIFWGMMLGCFLTKSEGERDIFAVLQEIINKFASLRNEQTMVQNRNFDFNIEKNNTVSDLRYLLDHLDKLMDVNAVEFDFNTRRQILEWREKMLLSKHYGDKIDKLLKQRLQIYDKEEISKKMELLALEYYTQNPLEWKFKEILFKDPYFLEDLKISYYNVIKDNAQFSIAKQQLDNQPIFQLYKLRKLIESFISNNSMKEIPLNVQEIILLIKRFINEQYANGKIGYTKQFLNSNISFNKSTEFQLWEIQSSWLEDDKRNKDYPLLKIIISVLIDEAIGMTKLNLKNKGWQYEQRIAFLNRIKNLLAKDINKETIHEKDLQIIEMALETGFEGNARIEDIKSHIFANLYAFLFKYKDVEQLDKYLDQKNISEPQYGFLFWSALYGYSSLSNKQVIILMSKLDNKDKKIIKDTCIEIVKALY